MPEISINYLAVFLAGVANLMVGALWYGPLFGKKWQALMGFTAQSMKDMKMTPIQAMFGGFISSLVMAVVLAHDAFVWQDFFAGAVGSFQFALQLAFWIWLGYVATTQLGVVLWEGKSWRLFVLNAGYSLIALVVMSLLLTYIR